MDILTRIFEKPIQVTEFWASDRYLTMQMRQGNVDGRLYKYCPEHVRGYQPAQDGDWYFQVGESEASDGVGEFLPRILPTRENLVVLNRACVEASHVLHVVLGNKPMEEGMLDDRYLLSGIRPYRGDGPIHIANDAYRADLWQVFAEDWGLELPTPDRFGIDPVVVTHRPGMPCAAAMVRSVQPIIEAVHGELRKIDVSTMGGDGRVFDVVRYRCADERVFTQKYDITDVFGRHDLHWLEFDF